MDDDSTAVLLRKLTGIASEISEIPDSKSVVRKDCCNLTRRLRLLVPLFEELGEIMDRFSESSMAALVLLKEALENARELLRFCSKSSKIYLVLEREQIKLKFHELNFRFEQALGGISYDELEISDEVKEQVELVHTQFRRANERIDAPVLDLSKDLFSICNLGNDVDAEPAASTLSDILKLIGVEDVKQESLALHEIVIGNCGDPGDSIQKMSILLKKLEEFVQPENEEKSTLANKICSLPGCSGQANTDQSQSPAIPDDFRCPISLELMKEPVIISTGQTYERACIKKWLDAGHGTCPKTQQILSGTTLTPNYVLCSLISNWCLANGLEPPKRSGHYLHSKASSASCGEGVELDTLMSKLTSNNIEDQRSAAGELRRLAKYNGDNRVFIAEAGAIPLLVGLLYTTDTRTQEHAVTALLNLSICEDNKGIITSEALPGILHVLKNGSMEARENAAATLFSLSAVDEYKVTIGASGAIPALVALLSDGSQRGKVDAATALFNLCIYQGNKGRAVRAGVVPMLMTLMTQPGSEMVDEALAVMAILSSHPDGRAAIGALEAVPTLVELIGNGSPRNKENATAVLVQLCMGEPTHLSKAQSLGVTGPLLDLAENGTERGKRKAAQLLVLIHSSAECRDQAQVQADNAQPHDQVIVE